MDSTVTSIPERGELKPCPFLYDQEDAELVTAHRWHIKRCRRTSYVARSTTENGKRRCIYLHREIMRPPDGMEIDHINGDGLDNRRPNLRVVSHAVNLANNRQAAGRSGYRGVWKAHNSTRWAAVIKRNGKRHVLGTFDSPELAHAAWLSAAATLERMIEERG
jgi:hypothetical protein